MNKDKQLLFRNMKIIFGLFIAISIISINVEVIENKELDRKAKILDKYKTKESTTFSKKTNNNIDFKALYEENSDIKGWLKVNNTKIDYPLVQASDNDYYLNHSFDKSDSNFGWVFLDYRNNINNLDSNTIIYAHTISYGSDEMFTTLVKVLEKDWYTNEDNQTITITTPDKIMYFRIFSIYTIVNENYYLINNFENKKDHRKFIKTLLSRSINNFNITVTEKDKILTLSTCYNNTERLVVHAKLKETIYN